jgi:hypothetical protein
VGFPTFCQDRVDVPPQVFPGRFHAVEDVELGLVDDEGRLLPAPVRSKRELNLPRNLASGRRAPLEPFRKGRSGVSSDSQ